MRNKTRLWPAANSGFKDHHGVLRLEEPKTGPAKVHQTRCVGANLDQVWHPVVYLANNTSRLWTSLGNSDLAGTQSYWKDFNWRKGLGTNGCQTLGRELPPWVLPTLHCYSEPCVTIHPNGEGNRKVWRSSRTHAANLPACKTRHEGIINSLGPQSACVQHSRTSGFQTSVF